MSNIYDLIIKNGNCFINNNLTQTDIVIKDNQIIKVGLINEGADKVLDAKGLTIIPGARLDDLLEVTAQTSEAGRASLVLTQQAWLTTDGERKLLAEGTIRIGWVDSQTLKPGRIPVKILEALQ